jgi:DNA (cytosine-5)-methyltransferase 1
VERIEVTDTGSCGATGWGERRNEALEGSGGHADGAVVAGGLGEPEVAGPLRRDRELDSAATGRGMCGPVEAGTAGPTNGFWADAEWLWCKDNKYRPVESTFVGVAAGTPAHLRHLRDCGLDFYEETEEGMRFVTHPLARGAKARILRLRGAGDCITAPVATEFIRAAMSLR